MIESFVQNTIVAIYDVIAEDDEEEEIFAQKSFENIFAPESYNQKVISFMSELFFREMQAVKVALRAANTIPAPVLAICWEEPVKICNPTDLVTKSEISMQTDFEIVMKSEISMQTDISGPVSSEIETQIDSAIIS